jgi:hypothetical protein
VQDLGVGGFTIDEMSSQISFEAVEQQTTIVRHPALQASAVRSIPGSEVCDNVKGLPTGFPGALSDMQTAP